MMLTENNYKRTKTCSEEYSFTWKIEDFHKFQSFPDLLANQKINFSLGSKINLPTKWHCCLQKSSHGNKTAIWLGLLECPPDSSKIVVNFQIHSSSKYGNKWYESAFTNDMVVERKRMRRSLSHLIENNSYCMQTHCKDNGGALVLHVSVTLFNLEQTERQILFDSYWNDWKETQQTKFSPSVASYYKSLERKHTNTVLVSSDHLEFPVMRDILCVQSPVFARMFQSGMVEESGIVNISDVSGKALKPLLEYIHTGNLNKSWTQPEIIEEFVYATHKYMLKDLLEFQDKILGFYCTRENVDALLDLAKLLGLKRAEKELRKHKNKGSFWREGTPFLKTFKEASISAHGEILNRLEPIFKHPLLAFLVFLCFILFLCFIPFLFLVKMPLILIFP